MMPQGSKIPPGRSYLFTTDGTYAAYAALKHLLINGSKGLIISKTHPDKIPKRHEVGCPVIWIIAKPPPGSQAITVDPTRLGRIYSLVSEFVKNNPSSAVLIDGIEYLIGQNDFQSVMKTLQLINESIVLTMSVFLLPIDPSQVGTQELSFLEREIQPIDIDVDLL